MKRLVIVLFGALVACGDAAPKTATAVADTLTHDGRQKPVADKPNVEKVRKVQVPMTIQDQTQAAAWYAENYWNLFAFADTAYINSGQLEQAFADWVAGVLIYVPSDVRQKSFSTTYNKAYAGGGRPMVDEFVRLAERYLYDPNSPMRNEEVYIDALRATVGLSILEPIEKIRPKAQLELALKNRPGDPASDIAYTTIDGKRGKLSGLKGKQVVLFFNNPGCEMCKDMRQIMVASPVLSQGVAGGKLVVLAVYPDAEVEKWIEYAPNIPTEWLNVRADERIKADQVYDLRAIPAFYLIDEQGRVVLKDVTIEQLLGYLSEQNS